MTATTIPLRADDVRSARVSHGYETAAFDALGHRFAVRCTDPHLGRFLDRAFAALGTDREPVTSYLIIHDADDGWLRVYEDERVLVTCEDPAWTLRELMWQINRGAIAASRNRVTVHAAAAELDGVGVMLPAAMEAGKTTLVSGLLRTGFRYLSDEAVSFAPDDPRMIPYPKPLSVDPGSWTVLQDLDPRDGGVSAYLDQQWQVPPSVTGSDAVAGPVPARLIVAPRYVAGAQTTLEEVSGARSLVALAEQTFANDLGTRTNLEVLAEVVRGCGTYRLTVGDLNDACELILGLVREVSDGDDDRD